MNKKYCIIIDAYPQTKEDQDLLLENLKIFKRENLDVLLTSHHPCNEEIIQNSTYFIFEKKNNYHFLDSDIINENIKEIQDPVYLKYLYIGDEIFRDRTVITGWSVAVTSQMFNSIKFLHGKGYDYAFYFVSDFICPQDVKHKLEDILEKSKEYRNYFIKNSPLFSSWYAGFFFGFTIDDTLVSRIPSSDFSENSVYQRYFPNCSAEDVILRIWNQDNNLIEDHNKLDEFFGRGKWNLVSSSVKEGSSSLNFNTSSSLYFNPITEKLCLMLHVSGECYCEEVSFEIQILDSDGNSLLQKNINLPRFHWFKEDVSYLIQEEEILIFNKCVKCKNNETIHFKDSITLRKEDLGSYSILKNFEKI